MKKIIIVLVLILLVLLFRLFKYDIMALNLQTEQQDEELMLKSIASIPEENIYLYALPEQDGWYQGMILSINGVNKFYDWKSTTSPSFLPTLYYLDLNNDGKKELVLLIVENHGTGMYENTVHIINPEDLSEYPIQNALDIIEENVETKIISEKEVDIKINDTIYNVKIGDVPQQMRGTVPTKIPKIYYEDSIEYYMVDFYSLIMDNILRVRVGAETQPLKYLGFITIDYSFKDGEFKADKIVFKGNPTVIVTPRQLNEVK